MLNYPNSSKYKIANKITHKYLLFGFKVLDLIKKCWPKL